MVCSMGWKARLLDWIWGKNRLEVGRILNEAMNDPETEKIILDGKTIQVVRRVRHERSLEAGNGLR